MFQVHSVNGFGERPGLIAFVMRPGSGVWIKHLFQMAAKSSAFFNYAGSLQQKISRYQTDI
jgi:hypothetical protein